MGLEMIVPFKLLQKLNDGSTPNTMKNGMTFLKTYGNILPHFTFQNGIKLY